jgi:serine/threonine protein kinase/Tfp pilus assembly protein PilF
MQPAPPAVSTCPICGGVLEETSGGALGCMVCLLRAGIGGEEEVAQDSTHEALEGGVHFGVYQVDRREDGSLYELGCGAMGVTYRSTDTTLQRKVALKIIKIDVAKRSVEARERFMREARAAGALRHENIATVYQFGIREETGQYFYAMELIEGETLEERVRRAGPFDASTTIDIAQQVTSALAAAEKHGLLHRDLKPANLMLVSPDGETTGTNRNNEKLLVKIIDFGLAKALHTQTDPQSLTHDRFVGTPAFASPEQFEHSALDVRSDIYSLGETLWFALTRKTPFAGHSAEEIHRAQQSNALPIEQLKAAHVPSRLRSLLESMLALEPASRPGTHELAARLQRCSPEARSVRRTGVSLAVAAFLILSLSAFLIFVSLRSQNSFSNLRAPGKSIAVLPFENLSEEKANAYFADGVQDEILTDLAKIADLKVISRTSVLHYKSGVARNLREIAQQLGVANVVEGSVQRSGNRVRVNAQLVDARNDAHLWAQTYDRDLEDVFAIQSEIAKAIADQLRAKLSPAEKNAIEQRPTYDLTAFDRYSRAKTLILTNTQSISVNKNLLEAIELLNGAVARDPFFYAAFCQLAVAHDQLYANFGDHTPARLAAADAALQRATLLRPTAGETHLARGSHLYRAFRDYKGALSELEAARAGLPNDPRILQMTGYILRRQGKHEEGIRALEQAVALDPRNPVVLLQLSVSYDYLRRYPEEKATLQRVLEITPDDVAAASQLAFVDLSWRADTGPIHRFIDRLRSEGPVAVAEAADNWFMCALAERDWAAAEQALKALGSNSPFWGDIAIILRRQFGEGLLARAMHDEARARKAFTAARVEQEQLVQQQKDYGPPLCVLGLIDAALGNKEAALQEGRRAMELMPVEKDSVTGQNVMAYFAVIAAWAGEKDLALQQLATAAPTPGASLITSYGVLKLMPFWDPLRGDPRFEQIVASFAPKKASK